MNKTIKIILISVVAVGIAAVVLFSLKNVIFGTLVIPTTAFEKDVDEMVKKEIKGQNYLTASEAFYRIVDDIQTEASVINNDGSHQLSEREVEKCKKIVFYAFEPVFESYQEDYFNRTTWAESDLDNLKSCAEDMLAMNIAESTAKSNLTKVVNTVKDYYAAKGVISRANHCTTVTAAKDLRDRAERLKRKPLTNNVSLKSGLDNVFNNAKKSVADYIYSSCCNLRNNYQNFDSYNQFNQKWSNLNNRINEFENNFGKSSVIDKSIKVLNEADENAMNYYEQL